MEKIAYSPETLKTLRGSMSQCALARLARVSLRALKDYELDISSPGEHALARLGKALGVVFYAERLERTKK